MISLDCRAACQTQTTSKLVISEQVRKCVGQVAYRTWLNQQPIHVMLNKPWYAGDPGRHDGNFQSHRFEQYVRQTFTETAECEDVDPFVKGNRFRLVPHQTNSVLAAEHGDQVLERSLLIPFPHYPQLDVEALL
jgi:hypothetical protein